jgi:glycerol-3-phosphate dehydrogenase
MGGKWTSFRHMGVETVDKILKLNKDLLPKYDETQTLNFNLIGSYSRLEAISGLVAEPEALMRSY